LTDHCSITAGSIEDSLYVAPSEELTVFRNRDKFELFVVYDQSSKSLDDIPISLSTPPARPPLAALVEAMTNDHRVKLKSTPVLLLGGLDGWRREIGDKGISRYGDDDTRGLANGAVPATTIADHLPQTSLSSPASNGSGSGSPSTIDPYQLWVPSPDIAATTTTLREMAPSRFFYDSSALPSRCVSFHSQRLHPNNVIFSTPVTGLNINGTSHPPDRSSRPEPVPVPSPTSSYLRGNISDVCSQIGAFL
jgi:hypothetical protein